MIKKYYLIVLVLILIRPIFSQGESAVPFLVLQQSPLLQGAGQIGAAIPMKDALGFYYNPAQLGYFSHENNLSISFMPQKTQWLFPEWKFQSFGISAGYNFNKDKNGIPLSIGIGYIHSKFDFNDDIVGFYNSFDCFSVGASYDYYLLFNLGLAVKPFTSKFTYSGGPYEAKSTAFDFGAMVVAPLSKLFFDNLKLNLNSKYLIKPKVDFTLGYSMTNIGKKISYVDPAQSDPIPRTARLGHSTDLAIELFSKTDKLSLLDYSFTAEAENLLFKYDSNQKIEYKNFLGDIKIGKHLIQLKSDGKVVVHRGHIFRLFETLIITSGRYNGSGYDNIKSKGLGFSSEGLFKLSGILLNDPIVDFIAKHIVLEYYNANTFVDSGLETNFKGLVVNFRGFNF